MSSRARGIDQTRQAANRRRLRRKRSGGEGRPGAAAPRSEINITPFVDVVLVLLIIFMVVTPMLQRGVDVLLPISLNHNEQKDTGKQVIVSVRQDGAIFLGQVQVDQTQLATRLQKLLAQEPPPPVFVKGDRRLTFKPMRRIMEICHAAGAAGVALATESKKGD